MTRKEFGVTDSDWITMRDNCWWQRLLGSPSVTPKGGFFCEVAASMDMLFDGPGGWKIEKDWWKRGPEDFKEQLMWCEYCSGAFCDLERDANEGKDDVSPYMYKRLEAIGSPKLKKGNVILHDPKDNDVQIRPRQEMLMYQDDFSLRVTEKNPYVYISEIEWITGSDVGAQILQLCSKYSGWVIYSESEINTLTECEGVIRSAIYNTGTLHYLAPYNAWLFNTNAKSIKLLGTDLLVRIKTSSELSENWKQNKVVSLSKGFEKIVNPDIEEWRKNITQNGLMRHYQLNDDFNAIAYRTTTYMQVDKIITSSDDFINKMTELAEIKIEYVFEWTSFVKIQNRYP